jgi:dihydrofolate reductase
MSPAWPIIGLAIVSDDDCIADAAGAMPAALRNDADWQRFQAELDASAVTVLGRLGHEAHGNARNRLRMVVSSGSPGLERRSDGWWWNPVRVAWPEAIAAVLPAGGRVAVPGGQGVFDLFLALGYAEFHLTRAKGVRVPGGRGLFSSVTAGRSAEEVLAGHGLAPGVTVEIDGQARISSTCWTGAIRS